MSPLDLVRSKDGSMSLTKLAAASFHLLIFLTVGFLTYINRSFDMEMWGLYAAVAVLHAGYDKTLAAVRDFKIRRLDAESENPQAETVVVVPQGARVVQNGD
jgi:hypothetical protein